jgi:hypothetical protein
MMYSDNRIVWLPATICVEDTHNTEVGEVAAPSRRPVPTQIYMCLYHDVSYVWVCTRIVKNLIQVVKLIVNNASNSLSSSSRLEAEGLQYL